MSSVVVAVSAIAQAIALAPAYASEGPAPRPAAAPAGELPVVAVEPLPAAAPAQPPKPEEEEEEEPPGPGRRPRPRPATAKPIGADEAQKDIYDLIWWRADDRSPVQSFHAALLADYLGRELSPEQRFRPFSFRRQTQSGQAVQQMAGSQIVEVVYYEERMGRRAARLLDVPYPQLARPGTTVDLADAAKAARVEAAEKVLTTAIAEHDSAIQRGLRRGEQWTAEFRDPLFTALVNLRLSGVDRLLATRQPVPAETECGRIWAELPPHSPLRAEVRRRAEAIFAQRIRSAAAHEDYAAARAQLDELSSRFPGPEGTEIRQACEPLVTKAGELLEEAREVRTTAPDRALALLDRAADVWPALPGIEPLRLEMGHPVLRCAYAELPREFSPRATWSAAQRHLAALVCEGLVRWVGDPRGSGEFVPQLARRPPDSLERGRAFSLCRTAWSDARPDAAPLCCVDDVRFTVKQLCDPQLRGYSPAVAGLLAGVAAGPDDDPLRAWVRLSRDRWQPLALMAFPVLPSHCFPQGGTPDEWRRFAARPVGTGPYRPVLAMNVDGLRLVANPYYRRPGLPKIRDVVFERLDPPRAVEAFRQGRVHLIYDLRREDVAQLNRRRVQRLRTPTVWLFAPNYRNEALRHANVRLAIAHAIDRTAILDKCFPTLDEAWDRAPLTGPFPRDAWAYDQSVEAFQPAKAEGFAAEARRELAGSEINLRLVYLSGGGESAAVQAACRLMQQQVQQRTGFKLTLVPLPADEFYTRVVERHEFDLAYWGHTFPDATYWLEPLLDGDPAAQAPGGPNFLGYVPDDELAELFRTLRLHKSFPDIARATHQIHEHVHRQAVVIPLWQIDTYVAVAATLQNVRLDPLTLFGDVERWEFQQP